MSAKNQMLLSRSGRNQYDITPEDLVGLIPKPKTETKKTLQKKPKAKKK
jgi:hypothetical protein